MESIAIVGAGCRFPGANNPDAFWELLRSGTDAVVEIPPERWDINAFYAPEPGTPGKMNTRYGGFIDAVDEFDPEFFGISPREAQRIDPQQRLILEVTWEALENGGIIPSTLSGSQTGVFIGCGNFDFGLLLSKETASSPYDGIGSAIGIAANRLSYVLNLRGPSLTIETACSSSLVALHLAIQSLRSGESNLCLVGAVSLMLSPEQTIAYSQAKMMAGDGRCKTFDASADGYVRGEGCGVVVLKRLSDALADDDPIQAIIRGSAVNQDGLSNGLTAPNGPSQQAVIRQALKNADVEPAQISYVETHGTGTSLGDPIEVRSLKTVFSQGRQSQQPCWLGSVKTNIGHLEAAAGMAGLFKVVLALQHREIPAHLHLKELNPLISLDDSPFAIPTVRQPWESGTEPRLAGISSFGFGGTNAHVIIEEPPPLSNQGEEGAGERPLHLLMLSAKSGSALGEMARQYSAFLKSNPSLSLADVCFSANTGRSQFEHRLAVVSSAIEDLQQQLQDFVRGESSESSIIGQVTSRKSPQIAFLFTGQGSQSVEMGRTLYETQPVFRQALIECDSLLQGKLNPSLLEVLYPSQKAHDSLIHETAYTQPALFAIEYALYKLWQSWGIEPTLVMGHSVGEYVAACVAGVFTLEEALRLIAARGRLMQELPADGSMVAVMAEEAQVKDYLAADDGEVAIAAVNAPKNVVISGANAALERICTSLNQAGVKTLPLRVSHGFHSPKMKPMIAAFSEIAKTVSYHSPQIKFVSNLTGELATEEVANADYWCRHVLAPVRFRQGIQSVTQVCNLLLEVGAKPILLGMAKQCFSPTEADQVVCLPSLRYGQSDWSTLLHSLSVLAVKGVKVNWQQFDQPYARRKVALPTYPFDRKRCWLKVETAQSLNKSAIAETPILNWLQKGNTDALIQHLSAKLSAEEEPSLTKIVQTLVNEHQQAASADSVQDWFYRFTWQPLETENWQHPEPKNWLIFADGGGVGDNLANRLRHQGHTCYVVYPSATNQRRDSETFYLDPTDEQAYHRLLQEMGPFSASSLNYAVHLWSLEGDTPEALSISTLQQAQQWGCGSILALMKALSVHSLSPRLWLVTQGATPTDGAVQAVAQAPLWAFGRVIALEHPESWGGLVDLDPATASPDSDRLIAAILQPQGEDQIALRGEHRYGLRLVPTPISPQPTPTLKPDASYLITGGLGALGLRVAKWLVNQGARHLILLGRSGAPREVKDKIAQLETAGAKVSVLQGDVTKEEEMVEVFNAIAQTAPPLRGIIHAAGQVGYHPLTVMETTTLTSILQPKVIGAWLLHHLSREIPLDFFVMFSSIAGIWGSKGQGHYAAANHFLDALASYRHGLKLPALSISWGPWAEGGMANEESQQWLTRMGIGLLPPDAALTALGSAMAGKVPQITVADVDWQVFKGLYEVKGERPLLSAIAASPPEATVSEISNPSAILEELEQALPSDRTEVLTAYLQREIAKILGLEAEELPEMTKGFFEMGMDSLMAVELRSRLEKSFNASLPATLAFEASTIEDLAVYLSREVLNWTESEKAQAPVSTPEEPVWEADVEASLSERLEKLESLIRSHDDE